MKIKKIAATALVPAAVTGAAVSGWALSQAATNQPAAHATARPAPAAHRRVSASQAAGTHPVHRGTHRLIRKETTRHRDQVLRQGHARAARQAQSGSAYQAHASQPAGRAGASSGMSAFERCVAWRESGNNPRASSAGLFGILPSTWASLGYPGTAGQASVSQQKAAFSSLYAKYGTSPWAPYDGC